MHRLKSFGQEAEFCYFPFSFLDLPVEFSVILPDPLPLAEVAAFQRVHALTSPDSSYVSKAEHVFFTNI